MPIVDGMIKNQLDNIGMQITDLPLSELHEDLVLNCRGKIAPIDVADLVRSISVKGLQQPITVRKYSEEKRIATGFLYGIVTGHRRFTAFKCLEYPTIPCIVKYNINDIEARFLNLDENLIRKDIDLLQEAKSIEHLKNAGVKMQEIADRLGKSVGWVQIRFNVLNFPEDIQQEIAKGTINQSHIQALNTLPREKQYEAVRNIKSAKLRGEKNISVQRPVKQFSKRSRNRAELNAMLDHIMDNLGPQFATRVLAWSVGNISSLELFRDIKELMNEDHKPYTIPENELT